MDTKFFTNEKRPHCIIVGGGLAGLSAACNLTNKGWRITLLEKRQYLGGRAFSFHDPIMGTEIDNGQHVFLGCCHEYINLINILGIADDIYMQSTLSVPILFEGKTSSIYSINWLPSPLNLLPALITYRHLEWQDKARILLALAKIFLEITQKNKHLLESITFAKWLSTNHQKNTSLMPFWDLIIKATLNSSCDKVSAYMGIRIFQEGFMQHKNGGNIGYSKVGLTHLITKKIHEYLSQNGGKIYTNSEVDEILTDNKSVIGVSLKKTNRTAACDLQSDAVICTVPWDKVNSMTPQNSSFETSKIFSFPHLSSGPLIALHIWLDQPVIESDFIAILASELQWVFNKTKMQQTISNGQQLTISISDAQKYMHHSKKELRELFLEELIRLFPTINKKNILRFLVVKYYQATFLSEPGAEDMRHGQKTSLKNLYLAGDWTNTSWPSTMESAVISGRLAASELDKSFNESLPNEQFTS